MGGGEGGGAGEGAGVGAGALLLILFLGLTACGESVVDYVAAHRDAAREQLARITKVRELAQTLPANELATMKDPGRLAICDLVIPPHRDAGCDTWVIEQEQLDNPKAYLEPKPLVSYGMADWLVLTTNLIETGRFPPNSSYPDGAEADRLTRPIIYAFGWVEQVRYVIVVRHSELTPPELAADQKSYTPGSYTGEAILFELRPTPRSLGSVPFAYAMTGELQIRMRGGAIHAAQIEKAFADGVRQELAATLVSRLANLERPPPSKRPK